MSTFCRTTLNYVPSGGPGQGRRQTEVEILDGRSADLPGWQDCGFELISHKSAVSDWDNDEEIARVHYPEIEELARKMAQSDYALVSGHIKRSPEHAARQHSQLSPIQFVHSDFADGHDSIIRNSYRDIKGRPGSAGALDRNQISGDAVANAKRIVILQFWRNLGPAKMDYPLAWCDARTVDRNEGRAFRVNNYAGTGATFDALAVFAPENVADHKWYGFPELKPDEAVAFRTYDTDLAADGKSTYFTPHSAFRDPEVEQGKPARFSIEMRAHCIYV